MGRRRGSRQARGDRGAGDTGRPRRAVGPRRRAAAHAHRARLAVRRSVRTRRAARRGSGDRGRAAGSGSALMPADVVIVGAGSAGCVLAARLSENGDRDVVLLESGPDYPTVADLPPEIRSGLRPVFTHDWGYRAETALDGRVLDANRARIVGGCSATNAALAV